MISPFNVIIPARNEAVALGQTAPALKRALAGLPATVIYVLNATADQSAAIIQQVFADQALIIQTRIPGKTAALNVGDQAAGGGICVYLDADVTVAPNIFRLLLSPLEDGTADLVAPRLEIDLRLSGPLARRIGRVWADQMMRRPDAFMCCTAFSPDGQSQRGPWPDVLADDDWARGRINTARRKIVETAQATIIPPGDLPGWLTVRARWIRGSRELRRLGLLGPAPVRVPPRGKKLDMASYYAVRLAAEPVAMMQQLVGTNWGRDESSRKPRND